MRQQVFRGLFNRRRGSGLLFFIVMLILALLGFSCNPGKLSQRKTEKAIDRVITDKEALDQVWARVRELRPCVNDSSKFTIRLDTLRAKLQEDSLYIKQLKEKLGWVEDEYLKTDTNCQNIIRRYVDALVEIKHTNVVLPIGYSKELGKGARVYVTAGGVEVELPKTDTTRYIKDREAEQAYRDSMNYYKGVSTFYKNQWELQKDTTDMLRAEVKSLNKVINGWKWKYWVTCAGLLVLGGLCVYKGGSIAGLLSFFNPFKRRK